MKILIIRPFPDVLDVNRYNVQEIGLAKALTMRGHVCDIVLCNGRNPDRTQDYVFTEGGREHAFRIYWCRCISAFKNGFMPSAEKLLPQYDVAQVHEYDQLMSWSLYTRQIIPTVIYHGPYYNPYAKGYILKCRVFDALFLRRRSCKAVRVLAKSEMAAEFLRKKGFCRVTTAGVGLNTASLDKGTEGTALLKREKKGTAAELLYVGKIEDRRNVYFLIGVFRELCSRGEQVHLTIIGSGEADYQRGFLCEIRKEQEEDRITYLPKASQSELAEYYRAADLFVFPTKYDIFGMVLLECMYCGLPAVSTRNGGSATLIEDGVNGRIIPADDVCEWADAIEKMLSDSQELKRMGDAARKTVEEHYTWDRIAGTFEQEYELARKEFTGTKER